ncbi:precorrin-2 C(20)-methyltransferase [Desulfolutivibrio sulfoxidireducens]|uniref:precorrin-2 C(20)-methyltransferase n=1 Tax=Desulfolutivibrio sulfoxidireducens TaxID=2773299 RepID=UPI00159DC275|nr:precorrin-2 C(20)-methyltransferase [Desulfolutivibrio sulfoxidireducens]QLA18891.1 precorrin-2 C(20)-methyltransferase [Desulfolutivibrio sulfoxidireducens]
MSVGTLYGLGVGPGDPELVTLKAARILGRVDVILAASSTKNDYSLSLDIVRPHLRPGAEVIRLGFPMTRDQGILDAAWEENAARAADVLKSGRDAAFITLGDPLLYSTFGYLLPRLRSILPQAPVSIVPGITSFQAAAAAAGEVLAESGENLLILSGVADEARNRELLGLADRAVILKAYRNFPAIREMLRREGREGGTIFATRLGIEGERVVRELEDAPDAPHYLSLCLVGRRNGSGG